MSEEGGPCFGFKKKTVVMTCIGNNQVLRWEHGNYEIMTDRRTNQQISRLTDQQTDISGYREVILKKKILLFSIQPLEITLSVLPSVRPSIPPRSSGFMLR